MAKLSDVTVIIDIQRPTPIVGLGKPLILGSSQLGSDYKTYYDLDAVREDHAIVSEVYKAALALFNQGNHSPESIAVMMRSTDISLEEYLPTAFSKDWYYLVSTSSVSDDILLIGDAIQQDNTRTFFYRTNNLTEAAAYFAKKWKRTVGIYHTNITNYPEAAWIGDAGSAEAGATTWHGHTLVGIEPMDLTRSQLAEIEALNLNAYVTKAGDNVTHGGITMSGEYIDIVQSEDWLVMNIQTAVQKLFNRASQANSKIPFDNRGISQIEGTVRTVLKRGDNNGMIAHDDDGLPLYGTKFATRSEVDPAYREQREYRGGEFEFSVAGAIHKTPIKGLIRV